LKEENYKPVIIEVEDAYLAFQVLMNLYQQMTEKKKGIEEQSFIHETAVLGEEVYVGAFTYISEKVNV